MPTEPHYRYCPACRSEYTQVATRCIDCDVDLVDVLSDDEATHEIYPASELESLPVA